MWRRRRAAGSFPRARPSRRSDPQYSRGAPLRKLSCNSGPGAARSWWSSPWLACASGRPARSCTGDELTPRRALTTRRGREYGNAFLCSSLKRIVFSPCRRAALTKSLQRSTALRTDVICCLYDGNTTKTTHSAPVTAKSSCRQFCKSGFSEALNPSVVATPPSTGTPRNSNKRPLSPGAKQQRRPESFELKSLES